MTPSETPEQHVHASVGRQKKATKSVATTAKKLAKDAEEKAAVLAKATDLLSSRVGTLADAVQTNNYKIDQLQREINCKPDDVELRVIAGLAETERRRYLKFSVTSAVVSALIAGTTSYLLAEKDIEERTRQANIACERNNTRAEIEAQAYDDVRKIIANEAVASRLRDAANALRSTLADCDALHPVGKGK